MIVYFDLVVACLLNQSGRLSASELREALAELDQRSGWNGGLLAYASHSLGLPSEELSRTAYWTRRSQERHRQAACLQLLEERGCPQEEVHQLIAELDEAPFGADLARVLGKRTALAPVTVRQYLEEVESRLRRYGASVLRAARDDGFAAVSTRLVPGHAVTEDALRLSVLFRSEHTYWIVRSRSKRVPSLFALDHGDDGRHGMKRGEQLGPYTIQGRLGEGGMGRVYLATDANNAFVAVKTLRGELAEAEDHARFEREVSILARVRHRSVLPLLDRGTAAGGVRYFVVPAIEGEELGVALRRARLPLREAFGIADELLAALEAVHAAGVVHKDLKPENVMLRRRPKPSRLCLIDFGLAHLLTDEETSKPELFMTRQSELLGTPRYISPEQVRGEKLTPVTDLYAFGVLLFELLTGKLPLHGKTPFAMLSAHVDAIPDTLWEADPKTPWDLELQALLTRLLQKDPGRRPRSAAEVRSVLAEGAGRMLAVGRSG